MKLILLHVALDQELTDDEETAYRTGKLLDAETDGTSAWLLLTQPTAKS